MTVLRKQYVLFPGLQHQSSGFTLIEIMVALMVAAIGLLALGKFSLGVMDAESSSVERLTAVHLAEQVIEAWQQDSNDYFPNIAADCSISTGTTAMTAGSPPSSSPCTLTAGKKIKFEITATVAAVQAPLPDGAGNVAFGTLSSTTTHPNTPVVKKVQVSWIQKGQNPSIYLTHLTR